MVDNEAVSRETKAYKKIPVIAEFTDDKGNDVIEAIVDPLYFSSRLFEIFSPIR